MDENLNEMGFIAQTNHVTRANDNAMPCHTMADGELTVDRTRIGLTKLEYFASAQMAAYRMSESFGTTSADMVATWAISDATELIRQLNAREERFEHAKNIMAEREADNE